MAIKNVRTDLQFNDSDLLDINNAEISKIYFRDSSGINQWESYVNTVNNHLYFDAPAVGSNIIIRDSSNSEIFTFFTGGDLRLHDYGSGNNTGTATKYLAVDANGYLIEEDSPGSGDKFTRDVNQASHGLSVGDAIRHNGSNYVKALGDSSSNSDVIGLVSAVTDVDNFTYQFAGLFTSGTWTNGTHYFLSTTVAGDVITEPVYNVGEVRQHIGTGVPGGLLLEIDIGHVISASGSGGAEELSDLTDVNTSTPTNRNVLIADGVDWESRALVEADISDLQSYLTTEVNDLTAAVTWANVPDAYITQSSVTQHQAALSITESQISDLGNYLLNITAEPLSDLSDVTITTIGTGEILKWNGSAWINNTLSEAGIAATGHSHATSDITSGTFADARIAQSNVTQHQSALSITESQISDLQSYLLNITGESIGDLSDVSLTGALKGDILVYNGSNWVDLTVGSDGQVLEADSTQPTGLKWATGGGGSDGDGIYDGNGTVPTNTVATLTDSLTIGSFHFDDGNIHGTTYNTLSASGYANSNDYIMAFKDDNSELYFNVPTLGAMYFRVNNSNNSLMVIDGNGIKFPNENVEFFGGSNVFGSGDGVIRINDVTTAPTTPFSGGTLLYYDGTDFIQYTESQEKVNITKSAQKIKSITIESPTGSEDITLFYTDYDITIEEISAVTRGTSPSVTFTVRHNSDRSAIGSQVITGGSMVTSTSTGTHWSGISLDNPTIAAGSWIWIETTAQSGTVDEVNITLRYTMDA